MKRLTLLVILLLLPLSLAAQDTFSEGKRLFQEGRFTSAAELLEQAFREDPENLDASFYLGRAAFEAGDYETAAMAFERVLIMNPEATRVKLELARAYLQLGAHDLARAYFRSVQATNPPEAVWQQIQGFIDRIDKAERQHSFGGFVTLGVLHDDNVGAAPADEIVDVGGLPVRLDQSPKQDLALQATAVLNHLYRFRDTSYAWKSTLSSSHTFYDDETDFDLSYAALHSGLIRQDTTGFHEIQGMAGRVDLDGDLYLSLLGITYNHGRKLSRHYDLNVALSVVDKNYHDNDDRDATSWSLLINPVFSDQHNRLGLSLVGERENAATGRYDYQRAAAGLRYDRKLANNWGAFAEVRMQWTRHDSNELLFDRPRSDRQMTWDVGLSRTLWRSADQRRALAMQLSHTRIDNASNLDLYTYDKRMTQASLTWAF